MANSHKSVVVVGAGIIGTVASFSLAKKGYSVVVIDPKPGSGATYAAAGMIAPLGEITPGEQNNYTLQLAALSAWHELVQEARSVVSDEITLYETGTLLVGWDASDRRQVQQFADVATQFGASIREVSRITSPVMFEGLSDRITSGLLLDGDAWVNPDEAMSVLTTANRALGVRYVSAECTSIRETANGIEVSTSGGNEQADTCILATGAFLPLPGFHFESEETVRPVRGFTLRVKGLDRSTRPMVRAFVHGRNFYLVSRPGGECVLGASVEEKAEAVIEIGELQRLLRDGLDVFPALETAHFVEARSGLRPCSTDGEPFFIKSAHGRSAWVSGHYRHGVTLSPLVAKQVLEFAEEVNNAG